MQFFFVSEMLVHHSPQLHGLSYHLEASIYQGVERYAPWKDGALGYEKKCHVK